MLNNLSAEVYLLPLVGSLYVALGLKISSYGKILLAYCENAFSVKMPPMLLGSQTFEAGRLPSRRNEEQGGRV